MNIKIEHISKKFGDFKALDDLNFTIEEKQIFGIIGPNGAGKTTILKLIEGILKTDQGNILYDGESISHQEKVRRIGVQLQDNTLLEYATVIENIEFFASIYKCKKNENEQLIEMFQMQNLLKKRAKELSVGQQRNLCILLAFIHHPDIVILDEPSSGLDPKARLILWDNIKKYVKEQKSTVILTTHMMEEVEFLCENIAFINRGKLIMNGNTKEIINKTTDMLNVILELSQPFSNDILDKICGCIFNAKIDKVVLRCEIIDATEFLGILMAYLCDNKIKIVHLEIRHKNLEEIYLQEV